MVGIRFFVIDKKIFRLAVLVASCLFSNQGHFNCFVSRCCEDASIVDRALGNFNVRRRMCKSNGQDSLDLQKRMKTSPCVRLTSLSWTFLLKHWRKTGGETGHAPSAFSSLEDIATRFQIEMSFISRIAFLLPSCSFPGNKKNTMEGGQALPKRGPSHLPTP